MKKNKEFINPKKQPQRNHEDKNLRHGKIDVACGSCHNANASNQLRSSPDAPASFEISSPVCMQCHQDIFKNWKDGIHGKRLGGWNLPKEQFQCMECHNPHAVTFKKMQSEPPPHKSKYHVDKDEEETAETTETTETKESSSPESANSVLTAENIVQAKVTVPVESRIEKINNFPCSKCHTQFAQKKVLDLKLPMTQEHRNFTYTHVASKKSCFLCHAQDNTDKLVLLDGSEITMGDPSMLCGQCHGPIYSDWKKGIHGKYFGKGTPNSYKMTCASCHNPHNPKFKKLTADPPPLRRQKEGFHEE